MAGEFAGLNIIEQARGRPRRFDLAHQEQIDVVDRKRVIERRCDDVARTGRTNEPRSDNDGEIGLVLLIRGAAKQRAQNRDVADPGQLRYRVLPSALQQSADHEALAVTQLDGRRGAAYNQRRNRDAGYLHRMAGVELADLRFDLEIDQTVAQHRRREGQADTIALVFDRNLSERAWNGNRKLTAGKETCGVAGERDQIGLGQAAREALLLERIDNDVGREAGFDHLADEHAKRCGSRKHARNGRWACGGHWQLRGWNPISEVCGDAIVIGEYVPLHAQFAARLARGLNKTDLKHDLLGLEHTDRIDDIRPELFGDRHRLVDGRAIGGIARNQNFSI